MKNFSFIILAYILFAATSCKENNNVTVQFKIKNNTAKQLIYLDLVELDGNGPIVFDSAMIEKGQAQVTLHGGSKDPEALYRVRFQSDRVFFFLVPDQKNIELEVDRNSISTYSINSVGSQDLQSLLVGFNSRLKLMDSLRIVIQKYDNKMDSNRVVAEKAYLGTVEQTGSFLMEKAAKTEIPAVAIYAITVSRNNVSEEMIMPVVNGLTKRFPNSKRVDKLLESFKKTPHVDAPKELVGSEAPEFNLPDPYGNMISVKSLRGKYVLIDFWASWCKPCRMENPNVVAAFNKFKNKNFVILGVSLDKEKSSWKAAIKEDGLAWQHVSDLKYWDSEVVPLYNIEGIPFNVLVDPKGIIVAKNLRGTDLENALTEYLK